MNASRSAFAKPHFARPFLLALMALLLAFSPSFAASPTDANDAIDLGTFNNEPDAGGITIDPAKGDFDHATELVLTFPTAMAPESDFDKATVTAPVVFNPPIKFQFLWKSQTEGRVTIQELPAPGQSYQITLRKDLKDLAGTPVDVPKWGAEYESAKFSVEHYSDDSKASIREQARLSFTYPVAPEELARTAYYQNSLTRARIPAEVQLGASQKPEPQKILKVAPSQDLPLNGTYDLVLDGTRAAGSNRPLPHLTVFPIGSTSSLKLEYIAALNQPLDKPQYDIHFDESIDPDTVNAETVKTVPPVEGVERLTEGHDVFLKGNFDVTKRYQVIVTTGLKGTRGFGLVENSLWKPTFHPKRPAVVFPSESISQRSSLGLNFAFFQVNCGEAKWTLSPIAPEKLATVRERKREFTKNELDPTTGKELLDADGNFIPRRTELLVDALQLPVVASGTTAAVSGQEETLREIKWKPENGPIRDGIYLLEASAKDAKGRLVGNRTLVTFSDYVITQKRNIEKVTLRVVKMGDGAPVTDTEVRAVNGQSRTLFTSRTNADGLAEFPARSVTATGAEAASDWVVTTPNGSAYQTTDPSQFSSDAYVTEIKPELKVLFVPDRPLYRPGDTVHIKGLVRLQGAPVQDLTVPKSKKVHWRILMNESENEPFAEGDTTLSPAGGFDIVVPTTEDTAVGYYKVDAKVDNMTNFVWGAFQIQEYKPPLFSVEMKALPLVNGKTGIKISSTYFHGAPNARALVRWKAEWWPGYVADPNQSYTFTNEEAQGHKNLLGEATASGDAVLNDKGEAIIEVEPAFKDMNLRPRTEVTWRVDVVSIEGQTISTGDVSILSPVDRVIGMMASEVPPGLGQERGISVTVGSFNKDDKPDYGVPVQILVEQIATKTVREVVGPNIVRYREVKTYTEAGRANAITSSSAVVIPVKATGEYVVSVTAPTVPNTPPVSADVFVSGDEPAELGLKAPNTLTIKAEKDTYAPGDTAVLMVQSPQPGIAWVSVEQEGIIDTHIVSLKGNSGRVEFPVRAKYSPNFTASVYLLKPGESSLLPTEHFGEVALKVDRPDLALKVVPTTSAPNYAPGEKVDATVEIQCQEKPVANAEVLVYAVDDAVLRLGAWTLPVPAETFFTTRGHGVRTYTALDDYILAVKPNELTQKGFIIGGGGEDFAPSVVVRKNFLALAFWNAMMKTDAQGKVKLSFTAPDNLTAYRVVAIAQTETNQFGSASSTFTISKKLTIEPALSRFWRNGDEVELRAIVRQRVFDSEAVTVKCVVGGALTLLDADTKTAQTTRDLPSVVRFRGKIGPTGTSATVKFLVKSTHGEKGDSDTASAAVLTDAVELTLPCEAPRVLRKETMGATVAPGKALTLNEAMPKPLQAAPVSDREGAHMDLTVSTSPDLPKFAGLPTVLDYPHGCFEQISSRCLAYGLLNPILNELPDCSSRRPELAKRVKDGLKKMTDSQLEDGSLPYWPGQKTTSWFATIQSAWAVLETADDLEPDPDLRSKLLQAVDNFLRKKVSGTDVNFLRPFALMVCSAPKDHDDYSEVAKELYTERTKFDDEARCMLAIALKQLDIMPDEQQQLLKESEKASDPRVFNPLTFGSNSREESIRVLACAKILGKNWTGPEKDRAVAQLEATLAGASALSTQENLWSLLAFRALHDLKTSTALTLPANNPRASALSPNKAAAYWGPIALGESTRPAAAAKTESEPKSQPVDAPKASKPAVKTVAAAAADALKPAKSHNASTSTGSPAKTPAVALTAASFTPMTFPKPVTYLATTTFRLTAAEEREDHGGMRLERVVKNNTAPERTGTAEAPYKLGDELVITYRVRSERLHYYVALTDEIPAALEVLNPSIASIGSTGTAVPTGSDRELSLSHDELRDSKVLLYFDRLEPGVAVYSVVARVTAAGRFQWPGTQIAPMYDARFTGMSPGTECVARGDAN